jgi:hypothetical protein
MKRVCQDSSAKELQDLDECLWVSCFSMMHQAIPTVTWLGVGRPMPGRFSVRNQKKKQPIGPVGLLRVRGRNELEFYKVL